MRAYHSLLALALLPALDLSAQTALCQYPGAAPYRIDHNASRLDILVRKGGMFGHNHVVSVDRFEGCLVRADGQVSFDFTLAVADLAVDLEAARAAAGEEFEGKVSDSAKRKTRNNMLGPDILDGQNHPTVRLQAQGLPEWQGGQTFPAQLTLTGTTREVTIEASVSEQPVLRARGRFAFDQSEFGIEPFSALAGVVRLADYLEIHFDLVFAVP